MLAHALHAQRLVARQQRVHQGLVLAQRFGHPPAFEQRVVAVKFHHFAQVRAQLVAPAVIGNFQEAHMKALIHFKKSVGGMHGGAQFGVQGLQVLQLCGRGALGHHPGRVRLQQGEQVIDIRLVFGIDLGHISATAHFHSDQALGGQYFDGLAQGGAADAVFLGQRHFVDPATRR